MLNLSFTIQGDHEDDILKIQARGVVAAFYSMYGDSVLPRPLITSTAARIDPTAMVQQPPVDNDHVADGAAPFTQEEIDANAAFGGNEPDAAAAFGAAIDADAARRAYDHTSVIRDGADIPWDERIHSGSKEMSQAGIWKRRRNTPDALFDAVMAELKAANTKEAASAIVPPPPSAIPAPPTTAAAPSPVPAAPAASSSAPGGIDPASPTAFPDIMRKITGMQAAQKLKPDELTNLLTSIGATPPSVSTLIKQKDLIPMLEALLDDHAAMQG